LKKLKPNNRINRVAAFFAVILIRSYQLIISPVIGPGCRFTPSCSTYALEAISRYGILKGTILAGKRLARCHPWNIGGPDPVP
jgi:putative membrane protein insertion efficiency factor